MYWGYFCLLIFYCLFSLIYIIFAKNKIFKTLNIHYIKNKVHKLFSCLTENCTLLVPLLSSSLTSLNRNSFLLSKARVGSRYCSHVHRPPTADNLATGAGCQNQACGEGSSRRNPGFSYCLGLSGQRYLRSITFSSSFK